MRYIRYAVLAVLAALLVTLAVANRDPVTLRFLPAGMADALGGSWALHMPLFVVILGAAAIGVLVGFSLEWLREHRHRKTARKKTREAEELAAEVSALKRETRVGLVDDDVLALIEANGGRSR